MTRTAAQKAFGCALWSLCTGMLLKTYLHHTAVHTGGACTMWVVSTKRWTIRASARAGAAAAVTVPPRRQQN